MANGKIVFSESQIAFLMSKDVKAITPSVASSFNDDDGYDAFKAIRWGWTLGKETCPSCQHTRVYEFRHRGKFKCAKCGVHFSVTTGTAFTSRKLAHKTYVHAISCKLHAPSTIFDLSEKLSVNYRTAWRLNSLLRLIQGNIIPKTSEANWPYLPQKPARPNEIIDVVNKALPYGMPEHVRADVAQELILGVLEGTIAIADVQKQARRYIGRLYREYGGGYDISLDHGVKGTDGKMSWHDVIAAPEVDWLDVG